MRAAPVLDLLRRRLLAPLAAQLTQGLSPHAIALTLAVGGAIAVIPVVGTTTVLCVAAAILLRLNQPLMMAVNYLSFPLQLLLIVPYLRLGAWLFGGAPVRLSAPQLVAFVSERPLEAAHALWHVTLHALGAWLLTAPVLGLVIYAVARPLLAAAGRRLERRSRRRVEACPDTAVPEPEGR